jgi:hypothetical protein
MKPTKEEIQLILQEGEDYSIEFKKKITNLDNELLVFA